jgi:hypothetical protein
VTLSAGILPGQDFFGLTVLKVGDRCVIGRGSHIVAHECIEIKATRVVCTSRQASARRGPEHAGTPGQQGGGKLTGGSLRSASTRLATTGSSRWPPILRGSLM